LDCGGRISSGRHQFGHAKTAQNESPGKDKEANWLLATKGAFSLTMRLYEPKSEALTGKWNPPPVTKLQGLPALVAQ
jgi:hypothetical protein